MAEVANFGTIAVRARSNISDLVHLGLPASQLSRFTRISARSRNAARLSRALFFSFDDQRTAVIRVFIIALCLTPLLAISAPTVIVDAIPTGATLVNVATVRFPYSDLEADPKMVEAGINSAMSNALLLAKQQAVTYICLLSPALDAARSFTIEAAHAKLNLQVINPWFTIVLYRGGRTTTDRTTYHLGSADDRQTYVSMTFKKVSMPAGWTTDAWVYFNLSRIQDQASKAGATQVFLQSGGRGATSPVVIPGVRLPLMVFADETKLTAQWHAENASAIGVLSK
jgi:hypothetical protein